MTFRLPKDLLNLIFCEIEFGYDMMNFSEISRRCNQIFHQNLEVTRKGPTFGRRQIIYTRQRLTHLKHGIYRIWLQKDHMCYESNYFHNEWHGTRRQWSIDGQLEYEENYFCGDSHGPWRRWYSNGQLGSEYNYHHQQQHGLFRRWSKTGQLEWEDKWHYGRQIE